MNNMNNQDTALFSKYLEYVRTQNEHMARMSENQKHLVAPVSFEKWLKQGS